MTLNSAMGVILRYFTGIWTSGGVGRGQLRYSGWS